METLILMVHVIVALSIVGLVLLQHGKGADVGAAFGGGASGSLFGASGSANFLSRTTAILAAVFFATSLGLTWYSSHKKEQGGVMSNRTTTSDPATSPVVPVQNSPAPDMGKTQEIPK
jgi:preprotein translocase subunit SecG